MANPISATTFSTNVAALAITIATDAGGTTTLKMLSRGTAPAALNTYWPVLMPLGKFKTSAVDKRLSCGATPCWDVQWTAKYGYYHCPVGKAKFWDIDDVISSNIQAIRDAIALNCLALGVNDLAVSNSDETLVLPMPGTKGFYGGTLDIKILDYRNL